MDTTPEVTDQATESDPLADVLAKLDVRGYDAAEIAEWQALIRLTASASVEEPAVENLTAELTDIVLTAAADGGPTRWQATLLVEGVPTEDGRMMAAESITWRALPLALGLMLETPHSDDTDAPTCGRIDQIWRAGSLVQASGVFSDDATDPDLRAAGAQAAEAVASRLVRGISVDLIIIDSDYVFIPETVDEEIAEIEAESLDMVELEPVEELPTLIEEENGTWLYIVKEGVIGSACIVPVPAIAQASIEVVTASAAGFDTARVTTPLFAEALVASVAPLKPPAEWFEMAEPDEPTPITITDDGQLYGHAALWESCHEGYRGRCVPPPRSKSGYSHFHVGAIKTDDGAVIPIGKITLKAPHADISVNAAAARQHYDNTAAVGAFVRARDGKLGIWLSGCVRSDASEELVRDLLANPVSGDWRGGEMVAVHAVPDPGFPVLRASAFDDEGVEMESALIIQSGVVREPEVEEPVSPLAFFRPGARVKSAA